MLQEVRRIRQATDVQHLMSLNYLKAFIRLVVQILKQYSLTQPEIVPKLVATFRSPMASFIRLVVM